MAMVARNSLGQVLWWNVVRVQGTVSPVDGEAHAVIQTVLQAANHGWPDIIVEGDNLRVIKSMQEDESSLASYGAYLDDIKILAITFRSCSFSFVKRGCNQLAHAIATSSVLDCTEGYSLPSSLADSA
ncbi:PREDICTED: uncharacterized protein LOC105967955 [Erythranthe guttata]|uniref:uncharacterized protein LOC105967955 n=1 Tax=Erythranthe guttata TaxID=4155 RepID=UPI00064D7933|nr:PREDICTED: uncharacterized protein LOC105967955 [Erythranthe guttata]|eukprot:XP_012847995.1 PREDICTED: uncharacterized protein LOC105967955 [Erythranthe guttata]